MNLPLRSARRLLLASALLALAWPALPQASGGYTVELIVFRNGGEAIALPESARPAFSGDDVAATAAPRQLTGVAQRLSGGGRRVLAHAAWRQGAAGVRSRRGVSASDVALPGVTGKIVLERGTYLLLGVDIVVEDNGRRYRLTEMRAQVKPGELQYFDHPAVAAIAVVTEN